MADLGTRINNRRSFPEAALKVKRPEAGYARPTHALRAQCILGFRYTKNRALWRQLNFFS